MQKGFTCEEVVPSKRLQALVDMVTPGNSVVDVGCDHGYVSICLVQSGISPKVLAMDVRTGPLQRAKEHITEYQLDNRIETRLSDGLWAYRQGETETMICAGMGGPLMCKILAENEEKAHAFSELILQPQSELPEFRQFLWKEGYQIQKENILCEEGKYYFLMKVQFTGEKRKGAAPSFTSYGEMLLKEKHPVLKEYLEMQQRKAEEIQEKLLENQNQRAEKRLAEIREELSELKKALDCYK